jgi:hypothetical protein
MVRIAASIALAYLLLGIIQVTDDLAADPSNRPIWALRPTFGNMIFVGATWIARPFIEALHKSQRAREVAFACLNVTWILAISTGFIWCCITASVYLFNNILLQAIAIVVLFLIGVRVVMPWLNILLMPLMAIVAIPIGLMFPLQDNRDNKTIIWCKNCKHYKKSDRYEDIISGSWRSASMPPSRDLPCDIAADASDVWERYFRLELDSRTLYPKDCRLFESQK